MIKQNQSLQNIFSGFFSFGIYILYMFNLFDEQANRGVFEYPHEYMKSFLGRNVKKVELLNFLKGEKLFGPVAVFEVHRVIIGNDEDDVRFSLHCLSASFSNYQALLLSDHFLYYTRNAFEQFNDRNASELEIYNVANKAALLLFLQQIQLPLQNIF